MPLPHAPQDKPYTLELEGPHLTLRDFMEVPQFVLRLIEEHIGGPDRIVACFQARSIQLDAGQRWMTEAQIANALVWARTWEHACQAASERLSDPQTSRLVFKLR